jgi:hypothetical protein
MKRNETKSIFNRPQAGEAALCARFEWGVGVLLANAWAHKEAVQTSDLPLLTSCMTRVMQVGTPM